MTKILGIGLLATALSLTPCEVYCGQLAHYEYQRCVDLLGWGYQSYCWAYADDYYGACLVGCGGGLAVSTSGTPADMLCPWRSIRSR